MAYMTIRAFSRSGLCPVSEHTLRERVKRGQIPGFYTGSRFMIHPQRAAEALDKLADEGLISAPKTKK